METSSSSTACDYRLALALAIVKARSSQGTALQHWKKKAKSRKKELETLRKMLQQQQCDSAVSTVLPLPGSCKCSFFESANKGFETMFMDVQQNDVDQLLFRQFLRNVNRWNYANGPQNNKWFSGASDLDGENQLFITCKFVEELVKKHTTEADNGGYSAVYAHQAVEFLQDFKENKVDARSWIFQLLSKLGAICFMGQRILIMAMDQLALVSERLCFTDPFEKNVSQVFNNIAFVLQLIENLVLYHSSCWKNDDYFDEGLLEEWVSTFVKVRKTCAVLGKCNALFLAYMERITSQTVKQIQRLSNMEGGHGKNMNEAFLKFLSAD